MEGKQKKTRPSENKCGKMDATTRAPPTSIPMCVRVRVACYLIFVSSREREKEEKKKNNQSKDRNSPENLTGPKLKGRPKLKKSPKATDHFKFPRQESKTLTREPTQKTAQL